MAPSDILKCSGASFPVGFSTSKTWRLTPSVMAFPSLIWRFLMQLAAQKTLNCTDCALRPTLVGARPFHNGNIVANCPVLPSVLRRSRNLPNSQAPEPTGVKNVEQVYAIYSDRDGAWHRDGDAGLQLSARYPGGYRSR